MSRNDLNIEKLFQSGMDAFKMDPSPGLWQKVHTKLLWKQFFSFSLQTFNVYYLAAAISLAGMGTYMVLSGQADEEPPAQELQQSPVITEIRTEEQQAETKKEAEPGTVQDPVPETDQSLESADRADPEIIEPQVPLKEENTPENAEPVAASRPSGNENTPEENIKKSESLLVSVAFEANRLSGCSPLAVNFTNNSENALRYTWTFGDGGSSSEKDPSYIFDEPGEYPVVLRIEGADGKEYSSQVGIRVFESPKALFEIDEFIDPTGTQPVYFYNYSRDADHYLWEFGDEQVSDLAEPIHYYEQPGTYNVKLKVWTDNHCYDSLVILNALTSSENEIKFPNAFTPNMTGPTGGFYDLNDVRNNVFHPVITGDLLEYQLKVFNRQGVLIFESKDIAVGWDGYYEEQLARQGVYIWKVRGKFSNGETFVRSGDVTLIRQY